MVDFGAEVEVDFGCAEEVVESGCFSGEAQGCGSDVASDGVFAWFGAREHESCAVVDTDLALGDDGVAD